MDTVSKSPYDKREFDVFSMSNGMSVFLINDVKAVTNSCAMLVNVGYMSDTCEGMAHLTEHTLFLGTHKYPGENYFQQFILKHGGETNAYTSHSNTCYYYTINHNYIEESLDMFASMFDSPLFNEKSIQNELNVINAEHEKNKNNDDWRHSEIIKLACKHHAYSKFSTGNDDTLRVDGIDKCLKNFFNEYYVPQNMILFIMTNKNIKHIIIDKFEKITHKETFHGVSTQSHHINHLLNVPCVIKIHPVMNIDSMSIYWELELDNEMIKFVSYLLFMSFPGSLRNILSSHGYVTYMRKGSMVIKGDNKMILELRLILTPAGINHKIYIMTLVYEYIDELRNISKSHMETLFNDMIQIRTIDFLYNFKTSLIDIIETYLSNNIPLNKISVSEIINKTYIHEKTLDVLDRLKPHNAVTILSSQKYLELPNTYSNYGIKYKLTNGYFELIDATNISNTFKIPPKNNYIPTSLNLIDMPSTTSSNQPIKISKKINAYWKPDISFGVPHACIVLGVCFPDMMKSVEIYTCSMLYIKSVLQDIQSNLLQYMNAGHFCDMELDGKHLNIKIISYESNVMELCKYIVETFLAKNTTRKSLNKTLHSLIRYHTNLDYESPYVQLGHIFEEYICNEHYSNEDILRVLNNIDKLDIIENFNSVLHRYNINLLMYGNVGRDVADEITSFFEEICSDRCNKIECTDECKGVVKSIGNDDIIDDIIDVLKHYVVRESKISNEKNNAVGYYVYITTFNPEKIKFWKDYCIMNILEPILYEHFFNVLRIQESFGYIVNFKIIRACCIHKPSWFCNFVVQSTRKPKQIIKRINTFLSEFLQYFSSMDENELVSYIESRIDDVMSPFIDINEIATYCYDSIELNYHKHDINELKAFVYKNINKNDIIEMYNRIFLNTENHYIVLCRGEHVKI